MYYEKMLCMLLAVMLVMIMAVPAFGAAMIPAPGYGKLRGSAIQDKYNHSRLNVCVTVDKNTDRAVLMVTAEYTDEVNMMGKVQNSSSNGSVRFEPSLPISAAAGGTPTKAFCMYEVRSGSQYKAKAVPDTVSLYF